MLNVRLFWVSMVFFFNPLIEKCLGQELPNYAPGSLIIKFNKSAVGHQDYHIRILDNQVYTGLTSIDLLGAQFGATSFKPFYFELFDPEEDSLVGKDRMFVFQFPATSNMENIANVYRNNYYVEEAYPNYLFYITVTPSDPHYSTQWALPTISAPSAWDINTGSSSIVIGILDTGVDLDHPDIDSKLVSSQYRRDEVDIDVDSYTFFGFVLDPNEDYVTPDNVPQDRNGHGTHVAGIAGAATNNSGVAGVAWECEIMPLRAGFNISYQGNYYGVFEIDDWARVLDWATNSGRPDIINMSFGGPQAVNQSNIEDAYNSGITLVAASGNNNSSSEYYPAAFNDYVIAIGATNQSDDRCDGSDWGSGYGSNYGSWLDVVAPGNSIHSAYYNNTYEYLSGTSMATPHVAGVAALMLSVSPNLTPATIRIGIENTADKVLGMGGGKIFTTNTATADSMPTKLSMLYQNLPPTCLSAVV